MVFGDSDAEDVAGESRQSDPRDTAGIHKGRRQVLHGISTIAIGGAIMGGRASATTTSDRLDRYTAEFGTVIDLSLIHT
jgi:hypothetical protein